MTNRSSVLILGVVLAFISVSCVSAQQKTAKGSLTANDYVEIQQVYARYNTAIDTGDGEAWAATFTADGVFINAPITVTRHDAMDAFIRNRYENRNGAKLRHWNTNLVINATPDGATATVYLALMNIGSPGTIASTGMYEDVLVKMPSGWRFKKRIVKFDPTPVESSPK